MAWSAVLSSPYNSDTQCVFAVDGEQRMRFEGVYGYQWGLDAPDTGVTIAVGAETGLTGDYNAKYTYARKERATVICESNPSSEYPTYQSLSNESLAIYAGAPDDEQVNCVRFYRTTDDGTTYYWTNDVNYCNRAYSCTYDWEDEGAYITSIAYRFTIEDEPNYRECCYLWEIVYDKYTQTDYQNRITSKADNIYYTDGVYTDIISIDDNNADNVLGTEIATDHNRPPLGSYVFGPTNNGTLFMIKGHRAYFCKPGQPEYWPSTNYVDVSVPQYPLIGGALHDTGPYFLDKRNIYFLQGTVFEDLSDIGNTFKVIPMAARTGAASSTAVLAVSGLGIFHAQTDGIYLFSPGSGDSKISEMVDPIFRGESINGMDPVGDVTLSWFVWFDNKLYFAYPSESDPYPQKILVFDPQRKKIMYYEYNNGYIVGCNDRYNNRFLACEPSGNLWRLENPDAESDNGIAIEWEIETKDFTLQTRKHYPRWNKYDVDVSGSDYAYGYALLDGDTVQTHTLSGDRDTNRRLIGISNGDKFSIRVSGSGPVSIYAIESE